jgi:cytoskeletal protein CcmA (bactofilin family)
MFNTKSKSDNPGTVQGGNSLIGAGTTIKGDIVSNGDVRIDGTLIGNIRCSAKVLIGQDGEVQGDVEGQQADVLGKVSGKIQVAELLNLRGDAVVKGNIRAGKLQVEPSVTFNGQCHMGKEASVVEMDTEEYPKAVGQ